MNKEKLWNIFKSLGIDGLVMNHYDLAKETEIPAAEWKEFLLEPDVTEYITTEMKLLQSSELNKMLKDISTSNSVGQAQLMNALTKLTDTTTTKDGPAFIYTYVPLSDEQAQADNIRVEQHDIFIRRG